MTIIVTALPLGTDDGTVATASKTSNKSRDLADLRALRRRLRRSLLVWMIKIYITGNIAVIGPALLLGIGVRDNIVWKQLVGGSGCLSVMFNFFGPDTSPYWPWDRRPSTRAGKLRRLGMWLAMWVKKMVIIFGGAFINVSFATLAWRMGDPGNGCCWVAPLLLCLQGAVGMRIKRDREHWWVRDVAMAFYAFGHSALWTGWIVLYGWVASSIASSLPPLYASHFIACVWPWGPLLIAKITIWCSNPISHPISHNLEELEEWRGYTRVIEGDFQYIIVDENALGQTNSRYGSASN